MSIKVTLKDGSVMEFARGTTVREVARAISRRLEKEALIGEVNGEHRDLRYPLNEDAELHIRTFEYPAGRDAFRHTSSQSILANQFYAFSLMPSWVSDLLSKQDSIMILMFPTHLLRKT